MLAVMYVGVDACPRGWIAVRLHADGSVDALVRPSLAELAEPLRGALGIGIDIPVGLARDRRRRADVDARAFVGPRRSSVFFAPVRQAVEAATHAEANAAQRARTGHGLSRQDYALAGRILEAERWRGHAPAPVWEVHPEVSFTVLSGRPPSAPKRTWAGARERLDALASAGIEPGDLGSAGEQAGVDDVLDAAVVAWSARRLAHGRGLSLPDPPEPDPETGAPMAIWA